MQKSQLKLMGAVAAVAVIAGGGVGVWTVMKDDSSGNVLLSAEEGAAARAQRELRLPGAPEGESAALVADSKIAVDSLPIDCGTGGEPYVPSEEELAAANADTEALVLVLDRYGISHEVITDPSGFKYVETDYEDIVAQSVLSSFWEQRYPVVPPSQAELDEIVAQNDVIARHLDEAGLTYTRTTDEGGWESIEWDYENPTAQEAVDAAYTELYPPQPPSAEELATMKADNDKLAAAFDAAGIAYTRTSDELGWEWIDWDYDDEATNEKVNAVFEELYPIEPIDGCVMPLDDGLARDAEVVDAAEGEAASETIAVEGELLPIDEGFTPEVIAQRDAEAAALASGLEAAGVTVRTDGESPWQVVIFDLTNDAAVEVVASVLATRA